MIQLFSEDDGDLLKYDVAIALFLPKKIRK